MMTLDQGGDGGGMLYAQVGQHPLARTTETSPERRAGTLSCLSTRPPDLATVTAAQPEVVCVRPSIVPFVYSKRAAAARSLVSRYRRSNVLCPSFDPTSARDAPACGSRSALSQPTIASAWEKLQSTL